jgi:hypothetical protein
MQVRSAVGLGGMPFVLYFFLYLWRIVFVSPPQGGLKSFKE